MLFIDNKDSVFCNICTSRLHMVVLLIFMQQQQNLLKI